MPSVSAIRLGFRGAGAVGGLLALLVCALLTAGAAHAQGGAVYVALGDSYTSAPFVSNQYGNPIDCERSDHNYPSLVAQAFSVGAFADVSCSGAQTRHMTEPQTGLTLGGTNPPQFNALRSDATIVTVGIGGNDAGLVGVAEKCLQVGALSPAGTACRDLYAPGGNDTVAAKIEETKPKIGAVLQGIHRASPNARLAIVGYPDVLPKNGGCYPLVPLSPDDVRYIDSLILRINAMIARQAALNDTEFVDTYSDSAGHDVCTFPPERWFEGLVPTEPASALHPNGKGESSMAHSVISVLSQPRPVPIGGPNAPSLTGLAVSPRRVRTGKNATILFRLDRAASVTFTLQRTLAGRRTGRRCVAPTRGNRRRRRCTRYSSVLVRLRVDGNAGANRAALRVHGDGRRVGRYRLIAAPIADGLRGVLRSTVFNVVPGRR